MKKYPWNVRVAILETLTNFIEKLEETNKINELLTSEDANTLCQGLFICLEDGKYAMVREKAVVVLKKFITNVKGI